MKIQLWDRQRNLIGGGSLPMIALHNALVRLGHDVWLIEGSLHPNMGDFEFVQWPAPVKMGHVNPDVFIYSSYWDDCLQPWGRKNWLYVLYPKPGWDVSRWDRIITISEYSKAAIKRMWGRDANILVGGVYATDWYPAEKKAQVILSCSRFFIEGDVENLIGHSKNQHVLIEAFKQADLPGWELWLAGSALSEGDADYFRRCERLAAGNDNIKLYLTPTKEVLRDLYSKARIFWHGMGYGREDPAEVEHYGYVLLKARMAGQWVISHNSGNVDLSHHVWNTPEELIGITERVVHEGVAKRGYECYTRDNFAEEVRRFIENDN